MTPKEKDAIARRKRRQGLSRVIVSG